MYIDYGGDEKIRFDYRFPWDFMSITGGLKRGIKVWFYYYWKDSMGSLWKDEGHRFFGFEIVKRIFG